MSLVKADLGTKRDCLSCSARFYDLQKRPIECSECAFALVSVTDYKMRRPRPEPEKPTGDKVAEAGELQESEEIEAAEVDETGDEEAAEIEVSDEDIVEVEEEEPESAGMTVVDPAEQSAEVEALDEE